MPRDGPGWGPLGVPGPTGPGAGLGLLGAFGAFWAPQDILFLIESGPRKISAEDRGEGRIGIY